MNKLEAWADAERGRISALSSALAVSYVFALLMVRGKKPVPIHHALAIEQFTGGEVTRKDMLPDVWQKVWPELATTHTTAEGQGV